MSVAAVTTSASAHVYLVGIYSGREQPSTPMASAGAATELGVRFTVSTPGSVIAIRFYKARGNTGPHPSDSWHRTGNTVLETGAEVDGSNSDFQGHSCT